MGPNILRATLPGRFRDLPVPIQDMFNQVKKHFWVEDTLYFYEMVCFHGWSIQQDIPPQSPAVSQLQFNLYGPIVSLVIGDFWEFEHQDNSWVQTNPVKNK